MEGGHRGNPRLLGGPERHRGQEIVHTLHMDQVIASLPDLLGQRTRDVEIGFSGPRRIPSHGQRSLVFKRRKLTREIGGEYREVESFLGNPPRDLVDVSLDSPNEGRIASAHHGDANLGHRLFAERSIGDGGRSSARQGDPETMSAPVLDLATREAERVRRGAGVARDGGACRFESGGAHGLNRPVVEGILATKRVREV